MLPTVLKPLLINPKVLFHQFRIVLLAFLRALWLLEEEVVVPVPEVVAVAREELLEKEFFKSEPNDHIHPESAREERSGKKIFMSGRCPILAIISSI